MFDTGSSDVLIPSSQCNVTGCTKLLHRFDAKKSTSFQDLHGPFYLAFSTGTDVSTTGDLTVEGTVVRDTVSVAGVSIENFQFALITNQTAAFGDDPFDGIVGMGFNQGLTAGPQTLLEAINATGSLKQALYGLYLTPNAVGHAEISFGSIDASKTSGEVNYIPVYPTTGQFNGTFDKVFVNGALLEIEPNYVIYDSGTANLVAPKDDAEKIYAAISPDIKAIGDTGMYGIPCDRIKSLPATVTFTIGGQNYTIPSQELSVGQLSDKPGVCQTLINASLPSKPGAKALWVIGGSLLKYYYTVWDIGNCRFGLAPTAQSPS